MVDFPIGPVVIAVQWWTGLGEVPQLGGGRVSGEVMEPLGGEKFGKVWVMWFVLV